MRILDECRAPEAQLAKLGEIRARTDRDLLVLIQRELEVLRRCRRTRDRDTRLQAVRLLLNTVETEGIVVRRVAAEIEALLPHCAAVGMAS